MYVDECTAKQTRVSFARMLVKINVTRNMPDEITIMGPSGRFLEQTVVYEWKPSFCEVCQVIGH